MLVQNRAHRMQGHKGWSEAEWRAMDLRIRAAIARCTDAAACRERIVPFARKVLRTYSSNFYVVTRFLPPAKRADVEVLYANVRYPDEVVDTFPLRPDEKEARLARWRQQYEAALAAARPLETLPEEAPAFLAALSELIARHSVPPDYYRSFLTAMAMDIRPRRFATLDDLIESYVYGSAIVVGYLLAYAFGSDGGSAMPAALKSARALGIGLQFTNFARDAGEDLARGRIYVPESLLAQEGITEVHPADLGHRRALGRAAKRLAEAAQPYYAEALAGLDAFAPDARTAIRACAATFARLNERVLRSPQGIDVRQTLPPHEKWKPLPLSKYWRIPVAYLTEWRT